MTLAEIQEEISRLPPTLGPAEPSQVPDMSPLAVVSKQGRIILRLSAATDALEGRVRDLSQHLEAENAETEVLRNEKRQAETRTRLLALETIRLMDTLDWLQGALAEKGDALTGEVAAAQRDAARRLAAVGITEIPCIGLTDGRLHEGVDTISEQEIGDTAPVPRYHIVSVVRRGWQCGPDVLRRASVVTAD